MKKCQPQILNKSIDELREMKAKGEAELKVLHNKSKYYETFRRIIFRYFQKSSK